MRTRSISTATALAVIFSSAALSLAVTGPATAATTSAKTATTSAKKTTAATTSTSAQTTPVTVDTPGGLVEDGTLHRVFVGDHDNGKILAADETGALVDEVDGIASVSDLALSADGTTLYAAAGGSHEVVALDAATLDVKARYSVATDTGPRYVAAVGDKVWFTYGDQWDGDLGSVDLTADQADGDIVTMSQFPQPYPGLWGPALLDTDPSEPGVLAVGETGLSTDSMAVLDVSDGTPQLTAWYFGNYSLNSGIRDIDLVPGTTQVLVNGTQRDAYADGQFTAAGAYPLGEHADIAANGLIAQAYEDQVHVYEPGADVPLRSYPTGAPETPDLTWAADSSRIFALVGSVDGYTLKELTDPAKNVPTLTVDAPKTATRGKSLTVKGQLTAASLPAGAVLEVTRTDLESPNGKKLAPAAVQADGSYSFTDTPPAGGTVTYQVAYTGDAGHAAVSASGKVEVSRTAAALTLNNAGKAYAYGTDVSFTAHLGTTYKNRVVEIWANPYGDKPNALLKTGTANSAGNVSVTVHLTRDTAVSAVFKGDSRTAPKTVGSTVYDRVKVSTAVTKQYRTAKIGSTTYYWFHKSTDPLLTTTMTYYPGRKQRLDLQVYSGGAWHSADSEYFPLGKDGKSAVRLDAPGQAGIKARVRAAYVDGSSGDIVNSTTYGAWKYLYFAK